MKGFINFFKLSNPEQSYLNSKLSYLNKASEFTSYLRTWSLIR